jgi:hypothetical protein
MKRSTINLSIGAAAVLFGLAACSSDKATAPNGGTTAEAKASTRQAAGEGAAMIISQLDANDAAIGASGDVVKGSGGPAEITVNCGGPDGLGWYTCTADLENGLNVSRAIRFWEGTSYGLWWNPPLTDSVNHKWQVDGTVQPDPTAPGRSVTLDDTAAATMRIVRPATSNAIVTNPNKHQWDGTAAAHHTASVTDNNVLKTAVHTVYDTVSAVLFQMPRSQNPYPLSGSITSNITTVFTAGDNTVNDSARFVVTFNGTHLVTLQAGGITCDLDLDTHVVSNCH